MTEKLPGWDPVAAGREAAAREKNEVVGTKSGRPKWWSPGAFHASAVARSGGGQASARGRRARLAIDAALGRADE